MKPRTSVKWSYLVVRLFDELRKDHWNFVLCFFFFFTCNYLVGKGAERKRHYMHVSTASPWPEAEA